MESKALETALETIIDGQKRTAEQVDAIEATQKELGEKMGVIDAEMQTHADFLKDIEERAEKARRGDTVTDNLKEAIPERMRGLVDSYARTGRKDPVAAAAKEAWLKNSANAQLSRDQRKQAQLAEENDRLAQAMGSKAYLNENTGSQGEYGVPDFVEADIYRLIEENGLVRSRARKIVLRGKSSTLVNVASNVTTYVVSEMGTNITQGEPTFGSAVLNCRDFVAYGQATLDVLQDEAVGLLDFFMLNASEQIGAKEDNLALEGTTTATVLGLGSQTTTSVYTIGKIIRINTTSATNSPTTPDLDDLLAAVYGPSPKASRQNSAWFMHPMTWARTVGQTSSALPTLGSASAFWSSPNPSASMSEGTLLGFPVYVTNQISTATEGAKAYFGAFGSQMVFGDRAGMDWRISLDEKLQAGLVSMRVIKRTGIVVANAHGFSYIGKCPYS